MQICLCLCCHYQTQPTIIFHLRSFPLHTAIRDDFRALPKNVWAAVGDVAVLECSPPRGHPEPEVKWRRNDEIIAIDGRIRISGSGNLVISDLQPEDAGNYQCVAQNMAGQRESTVAQLNVRGKFPPPICGPFFIANCVLIAFIIRFFLPLNSETILYS